MDYLETVDHELGRLEKLITRFLDFARLDLRIMDPQPQVLDVLDECRQVPTLLQPLAEAKEMRLETDLLRRCPPSEQIRSCFGGCCRTCWKMPSSTAPLAVR